MEVQEIRLFRKLMRRLQQDLGWLWKEDAQCCGITAAQCHVLMELGETGEMSLVELAGALGLDSSTLSRTVDGMVRCGLVERRANPGDRRYLSLTPTTHGRSVYEIIGRYNNEYFAVVFAAIPPEKQAQVIESIGLLAEAVSQSGAGTCCGEANDNEQ